MSSPSSKYDSSGTRRRRQRNPDEERLTRVIQLLLKDPATAVADLERDLQEGSSPQLVREFLDAASRLAKIRGVPLEPAVNKAKNELKARGFPL
jgi:hypothetical protein